MADAVHQGGFGAICNKAISFINAQFQCNARFEPGELSRAYDLWTTLGARLPYERYKLRKMHMVTIAVLIHAASTCKIAQYTPISEPADPIIKDFPDELTALVMGLILHDIAQRTEFQRVTSIRYVPIEALNKEELREALILIRERGGKTNRRRLALLRKILQRFQRPLTFH